jgi:hypothetical protein
MQYIKKAIKGLTFLNRARMHGSDAFDETISA